MVRKIPTILACVIFRLGKKIINDILPWLFFIKTTPNLVYT
jgi:hypothetical protein